MTRPIFESFKRKKDIAAVALLVILYVNMITIPLASASQKISYFETDIGNIHVIACIKKNKVYNSFIFEDDYITLEYHINGFQPSGINIIVEDNKIIMDFEECTIIWKKVLHVDALKFSLIAKQDIKKIEIKIKTPKEPKHEGKRLISQYLYFDYSDAMDKVESIDIKNKKIRFRGIQAGAEIDPEVGVYSGHSSIPVEAGYYDTEIIACNDTDVSYASTAYIEIPPSPFNITITGITINPRPYPFRIKLQNNEDEDVTCVFHTTIDNAVFIIKNRSQFRFYDPDRVLNGYWIERWDEETGIVKIFINATVPAHSTKYLYIYRDTDATQGGENYDATFWIGDQFDALNTSKWKTTGSPITSDGFLLLDEPEGIEFNGTYNFDKDYVIEAKISITGEVQGGLYIRSNEKEYRIFVKGNPPVFYREIYNITSNTTESYIELVTGSFNETYTLKIRYSPTEGQMYADVILPSGDSYGTFDNINVIDNPTVVGIKLLDASGGQMKVDWIRMYDDMAYLPLSGGPDVIVTEVVAYEKGSSTGSTIVYLYNYPRTVDLVALGREYVLPPSSNGYYIIFKTYAYYSGEILDFLPVNASASVSVGGYKAYKAVNGTEIQIKKAVTEYKMLSGTYTVTEEENATFEWQGNFSVSPFELIGIYLPRGHNITYVEISDNDTVINITSGFIYRDYSDDYWLIDIDVSSYGFTSPVTVKIGSTTVNSIFDIETPEYVLPGEGFNITVLIKTSTGEPYAYAARGELRIYNPFDPQNSILYHITNAATNESGYLTFTIPVDTLTQPAEYLCEIIFDNLKYPGIVTTTIKVYYNTTLDAFERSWEVFFNGTYIKYTWNITSLPDAPGYVIWVPPGYEGISSTHFLVEGNKLVRHGPLSCTATVEAYAKNAIRELKIEKGYDFITVSGKVKDPFDNPLRQPVKITLYDLASGLVVKEVEIIPTSNGAFAYTFTRLASGHAYRVEVYTNYWVGYAEKIIVLPMKEVEHDEYIWQYYYYKGGSGGGTGGEEEGPSSPMTIPKTSYYGFIGVILLVAFAFVAGTVRKTATKRKIYGKPTEKLIKTSSIRTKKYLSKLRRWLE